MSHGCKNNVLGEMAVSVKRKDGKVTKDVVFKSSFCKSVKGFLAGIVHSGKVA